MSGNTHEDESMLTGDLQQLGQRLRNESRQLEATYPCRSENQNVPARSEKLANQRSAGRPPRYGVLALTLICLFAVGVVVGRFATGSDEQAADPAGGTAVVTETPPEAQPRTRAVEAVSPPSTVTPQGSERFSVRALVASADMLEEKSEEDGELSDADKIALLEKALDRYRSVIIYLQDEIKTREEERAEQARLLQDLEERLQRLEHTMP